MLKVGTIARFLLGQREAILTIASSRWSLLVGALLVLSGSLARNYDGVCLPQEWPALTHGIGVSTVNALILFLLAYLAANSRRRGVRFWPGYLSFLGLFWMSSPMAWLYGIPYERFLTSANAFNANAFTLLIVSIWRVTLVSRVLAVLFDDRARRMIWIVLVFSDVLLLAALWLAPLPVIDFMGGMQQSPEERRLASTAFLAGFWGVVTLLIWIIGACVAAARMKGEGPAPDITPRPGIPRSAITLAAVALLAWTGALLWLRGEQHNRYRAEQLLTAGQIEAALSEMSARRRSDYPPVWDPPPRPSYRINTPPVDKIREALTARPHAKWVEDLFWEKCFRDLRRRGFAPWSPINEWANYVQPGHPSDEWWQAATLHAASDTHLNPDDRSALNDAIAAHRKLASPDAPPAP